MIDFHCHLDLFKNPDKIVARIKRAKTYVLSVTTTPKAWFQTKALAKDNERIRTAIGLHPQLAHERSSELSLFERILSETRYVGEIGLDGSREYGIHANIQKHVFKTILQMSTAAGGKIMSIHSRKAVDSVLEHIQLFPHAGKSVLHWFSGNHTDLARAVKMDCWFSVGPMMLQSKSGRERILRMPRNRILPETDSPFTSIKGKQLDPSDAYMVVAGLSSLWNEPSQEVANQLLQNFRSLVS